MVQFNFAERTIKAKVVYYGPAQSGKTTNLEQIHRLTDPQGTNRLISLNTAQDRTLFFDLLPFSLGAVSGYDFKVQLYTVPGQVQYNATRRVVLAGADAVVFVADARRSLVKENQAAFENMKVNLLANRLVPEKVPLVLQYNKQDLPDIMTDAELSKVLNPWGRPAFPAVAASGKGVLECFVAVVQEMLAAIAIKYNLKEKGLDPATVPQVVQEAFAEVVRQAGPVPPLAAPPVAAAAGARPTPVPISPGRVVVSQQTDSLHAAPPPPAAADMGLVSEELLHRSLRSNVELAEALAGLVREINLGLASIVSHTGVARDARDDPSRRSSLAAIETEAARLRRLVKDLGQAEAPAPAAAAAPPTRPAATRVSAAPVPAPAAPPRTNGGLGDLLQDVIGASRAALEAQGISVDVKVPPSTTLPSCPPATLRQALLDAVTGIAGAAVPRTLMSLRCERKPVLLRGRDGEVKRDFLMLALAHVGRLSADEQQRVVQGIDPGPLGQSTRLVREMGGFVRFAPLPGGALEARLFLPVA